MVDVRMARPADAEGILKIYSSYILADACTFETEVPNVAEFGERVAKYVRKYPWIVCEIDGVFAGYVYASSHRERAAYQWTCECSIYINDDYKGKGIGQELYSCLFEILRIQGLVNVYAGITLPNGASVRLHEKCGFEPFAIYHNIGYKLNAWHKVGWWRLRLNDYEPKPSPPIKFSELEPLLFEGLLRQAGNNISSKIAY